jgi:predicted metalloprotease
MRWTPGSSTGDVEDRRGQSGPGLGGLPIPIGGIGGLGGGGLLIVVIIVVLTKVLGGGGAFDPGGLGGLPQAGSGGSGLAGAPDSDAKLKDFMVYVFNDVQDFWVEQFAPTQRGYDRAKLVLYTNSTSTGCGVGQAAAGPFYCPTDQKVYLDLGFFAELRDRFKANGDFAQAYVVAHELGHHVQTLLGISDKVHAQEQKDSGAAQGAKSLSVRLELQADCLAGVWGHTVFTRGDLEDGDVEEALTAAASVGDDRIQQQSSGGVHPESFTHGTSAQRQHWFKAGFDSGSSDQCDTFSGDI